MVCPSSERRADPARRRSDAGSATLQHHAATSPFSASAAFAVSSRCLAQANVRFSPLKMWYSAWTRHQRPAVTFETPDTMFERYGGLAFISRVVLDFYDRVLASARLAPLFADIDMHRLVEHQAKFISSVMGGPESYTDAMLRESHAHLPIDQEAFDEMIGLLQRTLEDFEITPADVKTIVADLNARRAQIVRHPIGA
jgi:hemoglobin